MKKVVSCLVFVSLMFNISILETCYATDSTLSDTSQSESSRTGSSPNKKDTKTEETTIKKKLTSKYNALWHWFKNDVKNTSWQLLLLLGSSTTILFFQTKNKCKQNINLYNNLCGGEKCNIPVEALNAVYMLSNTRMLGFIAVSSLIFTVIYAIAKIII